MPASLPHDEAARLAELDSLRIFDTRSDPALERIARLAAKMADAQVAAVSLVGRRRQIFKATVGFPFKGSTRRDAVAAWMLDDDAVCWIADARQDPRFASHPHVVGPARMRFYAGAPIRLGGHTLGAVFVCGPETRAHDARVAALLEELAALVSDHLESRRSAMALRRARAETRVAKAHTEAVIRNAPVAVALCGRDLRFLQVSRRWEQEIGLRQAQVVGRSALDIFPELARGQAAFAKAFEGETLRGENFWLSRPDGAKRCYRVEVTPWRDARGVVTGVMASSFDITDAARALEQAKRAEARLQLALDIGDIEVWDIDAIACELKVDGRAEPLIDPPLTFDALIANPLAAVHPLDRDRMAAALAEAVATGGRMQGEWRACRGDDREVWVSTRSEVLTDRAGRPSRVLGVVRDITEQKQAEQALLAARDAAERANRAKSEFLANMSHEVRTPLNGVLGLAGALSRTSLSPEQAEMVTLIEDSGAALERLVGDLLDVARVESGRLALEQAPFDAAETVQAVGRLFAEAARAKGLALTVAVDPTAEGLYVGDALRLRQVVSNLLSNAVKFTEAGAVRVALERTAEGLRLTVTDTGVGFAADAQDRLFDRFEQADGSITRRYGGSGLGLAISRALAAAMDGTLTASSAPGQGAVFVFTAPFPPAEGACPASSERPGVAGAEPALPAVAADAPPHRRRVLLAEDHAVNRKVVELILGAAEVDLTCVENGAEAVAAAAREDFDLILMDVQMPVMDGLSAVRAIRAAETRTGAGAAHICALSAHAMPQHAAESLAAGADRHLSKPVSAAALLEVVAGAERSAPAVLRLAG